jgi:hypothetical protein
VIAIGFLIAMFTFGAWWSDEGGRILEQLERDIERQLLEDLQDDSP